MDYEFMAAAESGGLDPDGFGELYLAGIYVVNDEWISYRMGEKPENIDEETYRFLEDLGVGRR